MSSSLSRGQRKEMLDRFRRGDVQVSDSFTYYDSVGTETIVDQ